MLCTVYQKYGWNKKRGVEYHFYTSEMVEGGLPFGESVAARHPMKVAGNPCATSKRSWRLIDENDWHGQLDSDSSPSIRHSH